MRAGSHRTVVLDYAAIAAGGAVGSLARYLLVLVLPNGGAILPWATLAANLLGSFAFGYLARGSVLGRRQALFAMAGVLGSFTTFSTLAFEIVQRAGAGFAGAAAIYAVATLGFGLLAAWSGAQLAARRHAGEVAR